MLRRKVQTQRMVGRSFDFLSKYVGQFPEYSAAEVILNGLSRVVDTLAGYSCSHVAGSDSIRTSNTARAAARRKLKHQLELMDKTARALKLEKFWMPRNRSVEALIKAGSNFADYAVEFEKEFVLQGLPAGFIGNLKNAVRDLDEAIHGQSSSLAGRIGALREFDKTLKEALSLLRRLDSLVLNTMADRPAVMAAWEIARRLERVRPPKASPDADPKPAEPSGPALVPAKPAATDTAA